MGGFIMTFVVVGCDGGCFVIEIEVAPVWVANKLAAAATAADPTEDELFPVPGLEWSLLIPCNGLPLSDFTWNDRQREGERERERHSMLVIVVQADRPTTR